MRLPAAYNLSIYLMLGVGYGSFFVVGLLIYRGVKKNAEHLRARAATGEAGGPGELALSSSQPASPGGP
jgi:hypothetical protein